MTKEQLESYKSMKSEIQELKNRLATLGDNDEMVGHSVINDYRSGYPVPNVITGVDWERYYSTKDRVGNRLVKLAGACYEIEEWIETIEDSLTRRIFRFYYIDGLSQEKVGREVHLDRSTVSKKVDAYFNVSHKSQNATV